MNKPVQRVAAIHDLSGVGRVSLTMIIPILSTMGVQVCPLPTAVLSSHSAYKDFYFVDLTEHIEGMINHWEKIGYEFDSVYSGFLGSSAQIEMVEYFIRKFSTESSLVVIDPVLGDNGKLYKTFDDRMVAEMKKLVKYADVITPNITEASLLLDEEYSDNFSIEKIKGWLLKLTSMGPDTAIITSIPEKPEGKRTSVVAYSKKGKRFWKVSCDYIPAFYPGTGDAFTSVITGSLLQGDSLPVAIDRAVTFISLAIRSTFGHENDPMEGIMIERVLDSLKAPVQMGSYELLS
ncbi:MAG: pyridoxal kinase [Melioribacteraceae bacterium]|nr:MAG: pyridoxal kinase [Melioribacteraceae bacterium]